MNNPLRTPGAAREMCGNRNQTGRKSQHESHQGQPPREREPAPPGGKRVPAVREDELCPSSSPVTGGTQLWLKLEPDWCVRAKPAGRPRPKSQPGWEFIHFPRAEGNSPVFPAPQRAQGCSSGALCAALPRPQVLSGNKTTAQGAPQPLSAPQEQLRSFGGAQS